MYISNNQKAAYPKNNIDILVYKGVIEDYIRLYSTDYTSIIEHYRRSVNMGLDL